VSSVALHVVEVRFVVDSIPSLLTKPASLEALLIQQPIV